MTENKTKPLGRKAFGTQLINALKEESGLTDKQVCEALSKAVAKGQVDLPRGWPKIWAGNGKSKTKVPGEPRNPYTAYNIFSKEIRDSVKEEYQKEHNKAPDQKEIFALINKYVNEMKARDPDKALAVAVAALTPEQKKIAFELAVDVALQVKNLADYKEKALDTIKSRLAVSNEFAQQVLQAKIGIAHR